MKKTIAGGFFVSIASIIPKHNDKVTIFAEYPVGDTEPIYIFTLTNEAFINKPANNTSSFSSSFPALAPTYSNYDFALALSPFRGVELTYLTNRQPNGWYVTKIIPATPLTDISFDNFKGVWSNSTTYNQNDVVVFYEDETSINLSKRYFVCQTNNCQNCDPLSIYNVFDWVEVYCDFIKYNYTGEYSSSTTYKKNDVVTYTDSGVKRAYTYINDTAASGNAVTVTTHWEQAGTHGRRLLYDTNDADANTVYPTSYVTLNIHEDDFQYVSTLQYKKFIKRLIEEIADITVVVVDETDDVALEQDSIDVGISMREESETTLTTQQPPYHIETVTGGKETIIEISEEVS